MRCHTRTRHPRGTSSDASSCRAGRTWTEMVWAVLNRAALDSTGLALDSPESMRSAARTVSQVRQVRQVRRRGSRRAQTSVGASWAPAPIG